MSEKFTFFWNGPFSQWHPSPFTIGDITYNCAEQYMMACKALLFEDLITYTKIMASDSPAEQKRLGREVRNFDTEKWNGVAKCVVKKGNIAKFIQNPELKKVLLETRGTTLVEASPVDKIWGVGLEENDPRIQDRSQWQGTNWLGEVLTEVREEMLTYAPELNLLDRLDSIPGQFRLSNKAGDGYWWASFVSNDERNLEFHGQYNSSLEAIADILDKIEKAEK